MTAWLSPPVAVVLMVTGVLPSLFIVYLLWEDRHKPGVLWFLVLMGTSAAWAFLYASFTTLQSPALTLALANVFWAAVPTAAVAMFLLAYEYVFRTVASRRLVLVLFAPVAVLFVLTWTNPAGLVFTPEYHVGADGILYVPPLGGPVKILVTKVYGFCLVALAAGMFVGEALRSSGLQRRQALYLLVILTAVAATTVLKIAGLVPEYFDPTSAAYSVSGLLFAYSIDRHGLLKFVSVAREEAFQAVEDVILVVDPDGIVVDVNGPGRTVFEEDLVGESLDAVLPAVADPTADGGDHSTRDGHDHSTRDGNGHSTADATPDRESALDVPTVRLDGPGESRVYTWRRSQFSYGRGLTGELVVLSDVTGIERRRNELDLLTQILTRIFRHNMRNDLTVIDGFATEIRKTGDEPVADMAERIERRSHGLLQEAEKAHELEKLFAHHAPASLAISEEVARVCDRYADRSDVVIRTDVDEISVAVHPQFGVALEELVENAIAHDDSPGRTEIEISTETVEERLVLVVADDGPGIPSTEIQVLEAKRETSLEHSSGLGLWLVKLMVMRMNGEMDIESDADGTRISIHLQLSDRGADRRL